MGIDKKLVKLWKEKRADVVTTLKVLRELDIMKEDDVAFLTEKLDLSLIHISEPTRLRCI